MANFSGGSDPLLKTKAQEAVPLMIETDASQNEKIIEKFETTFASQILSDGLCCITSSRNQQM